MSKHKDKDRLPDFGDDEAAAEALEAGVEQSKRSDDLGRAGRRRGGGIGELAGR